MRLIGDIHGKYAQYKRIIKDCQASIQVGDMGVGFRRWPHGQPSENPPYDTMVAHNARFIRGNHDNPNVCKSHSQYIPDGHFENGVMFIGGGFSIDQMFRHQEFSWWPDEELSIAELNEMVDLYIARKPRVMITHDCPHEVAEVLMTRTPKIGGGRFKLENESRTRQAFQSMWSAHSPELHIFGHWHIDFDCVLRGTRFICLGELSARDVNLETLEVSEVLRL